MALTWDLPEAIIVDPEQEADRLDALHSLNLLDGAEERFDRVTRLAAEYFNVSMAYVAFIDDDQQWFKSRFGMCPMDGDRNLSLCQYTIQRSEPLIITDATSHPLSKTHPLVLGEPFLRFYAGVALTGPRGRKIGTFVLLDSKVREFTAENTRRLIEFAAIVEREINLAQIIQAQNDLLNTRLELLEVQKKLKHEFDDAAKYVRLMLPPPLEGRETIDWQFHPSAHLGGDGLGYRRLNADQIAFYVLDVTGHGLGSALLAVTALELLRSRAVREVDFSSPAHVMERLNRTFQMKDHAGKFFSVWYGVYSHSAKQITYANAGHPPPVLLTKKLDTISLTKTAPGGPTLGVLPDVSAPEITIDFPRGSQLCVFTDGLYEVAERDQKSHGSYNEFLAYLEGQIASGKPLYESMLQWLNRAHEKGTIDDDVTLLRFMTKAN